MAAVVIGVVGVVGVGGGVDQVVVEHGVHCGGFDVVRRVVVEVFIE